MTPLKREIMAIIAAEGPMTVTRYMALCLGHPRYGYYMSRDPFGTAGDFITAPEISQVFGELLGLWAIATWQAMGEPKRLHLVECGPGRGTLMADALRATKAHAGFRAALSVHLVEMSPLLARLQAKALADSGVAVEWHASLEGVPAGPAIVLGNEFIDALPIRQVVMTERGAFERVIGLIDDQLVFGLAPQPLPPMLVPSRLRGAAPGAMLEVCPAVDGLCETLGERAQADPLAALFIDYGHVETGYGETLQAVRGHRFADVLDVPGEADITAHVDFEALTAAARQHGLVATPPVTQATFLKSLGIEVRRDRLCAAHPDKAEALRGAVQRLIETKDEGMGALFKVTGLASRGIALPALPMAFG